MNFKIGKPYYIKFLDHSVGAKDKMTIEAIGWCIKNEKDYAVFTAWKVLHEDHKIVEDNDEPFSIIKSCIKRKRVLNVP